MRMEYENMSIEELYAEVRKNSALVKDENIKPRLKELTEHVPEDKRYPLLFAMVFLVANNYYEIPAEAKITFPTITICVNFYLTYFIFKITYLKT